MLKYCYCDATHYRRCYCGLTRAEFAQYQGAMENRQYIENTLERKDPEFKKILDKVEAYVLGELVVTVLLGDRT